MSETKKVQTATRKKVVIIGGGVSGALTAVHLLKQAAIPVDVTVVEPKSEVGLGLAYSTEVVDHLLNVPAAGMSIFADQPEHFLKFAQSQDPAVRETDFLPRLLFGRYVRSVLAQSISACSDRGGQSNTYAHVQARIEHLEKIDDHYTLSASTGVSFYADAIILALGNLPGKMPAWLDGLPGTDEYYIHDPWNTAKVHAINSRQDLLIVGSGLTAVDKLVELAHRGHQGKLFVLSRHGLLPQLHLDNPELRVPQTSAPQPNVLASLTAIRATAALQGKDWRLVIDGLRSVSQKWWTDLNLDEKRRFLRHVQTFWDTHRHRMAPRIGRTINDLQSTGQLQVLAGRIKTVRQDLAGVKVTLVRRHQSSQETLIVNTIINCTGPQSSRRSIESPLLTLLYERGLVSPHQTDYGLHCDLQGRIIDKEGNVRSNFFAIGPMLKAELLESVAVPEIKIQAERIALSVVEHFKQSLKADNAVFETNLPQDQPIS